MLRKAVGYHSTGLLPILKQCGFFDNQQWTVKRKDGSSLNLRMVFRDGFFNFELPYTQNPRRFNVLHAGTDDPRRREGYYPARARFGNQIPIEYIWAAKGRLTAAKRRASPKSWLKNEYGATTRITPGESADEDLTLLGTKLCLALEHIERSLKHTQSTPRQKTHTYPANPPVHLGHRDAGEKLPRVFGFGVLRKAPRTLPALRSASLANGCNGQVNDFRVPKRGGNRTGLRSQGQVGL